MLNVWFQFEVWSTFQAFNKGVRWLLHCENMRRLYIVPSSVPLLLMKSLPIILVIGMYKKMHFCEYFYGNFGTFYRLWKFMTVRVCRKWCIWWFDKRLKFWLFECFLLTHGVELVKYRKFFSICDSQCCGLIGTVHI